MTYRSTLLTATTLALLYNRAALQWWSAPSPGHCQRRAGQIEVVDPRRPTAALGVEESANVVWTVQRLRRERNIAVLLITHNLEEMRSIADRAVVLRRSHHVGTVPLDEASDDEIVARITDSFSTQSGVAA